MFSLRDWLRFMLQIKLSLYKYVAGKENTQEKGKIPFKLCLSFHVSHLFNPSKSGGSRRVEQGHSFRRMPNSWRVKLMGSSLGKRYLSHTWDRTSSYRETCPRQQTPSSGRCVCPALKDLMGGKHLPDMGQTHWGKGAGSWISLGVYAFPPHSHATELISFLGAVYKFL